MEITAWIISDDYSHMVRKRKIKTEHKTLIFSFWDEMMSVVKNSFTMESLILAQDER